MFDRTTKSSRPEGTDSPITVSTGHEEPERSIELSLLGVGRALFGGILAFLAFDNLRNRKERVQYAKAKGAPAPERTVPGVSLGLLLGSLGVALWRVPAASAAAVAGFFVSVTPVMHDFWNAEGEARQQELIQFLKNGALLGAALAFLGIRQRED